MNENEIEQKIIKRISEPRSYQKSFNEITSKFESLFSEFDPLENCFEIADYFSEGLGFVASKQKLINDNRINSDWFGEFNETNKKKNQDFSGLYVFIHDKTPFYVGISRGVIKRILQHVKGHSHHTSTLAYNIGLIRYELMNNEKHVGKRKELTFKSEVEPVKLFLMKQKIAFLSIENPEELALFEIYCAMKMRTQLNKFETH